MTLAVIPWAAMFLVSSFFGLPTAIYQALFGFVANTAR